jgi:putative Mn2+ efflux pump MntP
MRMGAVMMRSGSNLYLTPARTGLIVIALLLFGVIIGRAIIALGHSDVRTHTARENPGGAILDIGAADLRGSLP